MKLILKIAAGVCLGLLLFLLAINLTRWIERAKESGGEGSVSDMTPEILFARCGKPLREENHPADGQAEALRTATYKVPGHKVQVIFANDGKTAVWRFSGFLISDLIWDGTQYQDGLPIPYPHDVRPAIQAMPCLKGK